MVPRGDADERLRAAAQKLFLRSGFAATSTDAICREAQVSKETMYSRYPRKEDLLAGVLHHLIDAAEPEIAKQAPERRRSRTLRQELLAHATALVDDLMRPEYLGLFRLVVSETPRQPEIAERFKAAVPHRVLKGIGQLLDAHGVRHVDHDASARLFVGGLLTYVLLDGVFSSGEPKKPSKRRIAAHVDLYLQAVCAGAPSD
jgi:TetR/AcrR family transcriptional regulator, mexJK operon transcriptional repressor